MPSFIELPQLAFDGRELPSIYVNTADIITFQADYDGCTKIDVRDRGSEGYATFKTYIPLGSLLNLLGIVAKNPGVQSWSDDFKDGVRGPVQERLRAAAERERAAR